MDIRTLFEHRHSCRDFRPCPLEYATVRELVETAMLAPSSCNSQPWRVIITTTPADNEKMRSCLQDDDRNKFLDNASAFVALLDGKAVLKPGSEKKFTSDRFVKYDVGQFAAYLTLAAESKGISSCIVGWVNEDTLARCFPTEGLPCAMVVALGFSNETGVPQKKRNRFEDIVLTEK